MRFNSLLGAVILILDIIAIVDIIRSPMDTMKKILWILVIVAFPLVGLLLYYLLEKRKLL